MKNSRVFSLVPLFCSIPLLLTATASLYGCADEHEPVAPQTLSIEVFAAKRSDVELASEFTGRTVGSVDAEVRARVQGTLLEQHFKDGSHVAEGQLLYTIDSAPFVATLAEAKGKLAEAETKLVRATADLARIKPLADIDAVSKRDLDKAKASKGVAEGEVQAAQAAVQAAQIQLDYTKVLSPVSGTIGISKVTVGEMVGAAPNAVVLNTVSKLDPIHVQFSLSEKEYLYFAHLARLEGEARKKRTLTLVLADNSVHPESGYVVKVDRGVDVNSGAITVEAAFPNPGKFLRPGLFAKIKTVAETRKDAIVIPRRAIKEIQGTFQVYVIDEAKKVAQRLIKVGPLSGDLQVVEEGLKKGELVAVEAIQKLRSGMQIQPTIINQ
jgi:membrane fusion protein (multidrug efflux system)